MMGTTAFQGMSYCIFVYINRIFFIHLLHGVLHLNSYVVYQYVFFFEIYEND